MTSGEIAQWVREHPLNPSQTDCVTTVMLKILDGKCKMNPEEKRVMALLYDEVKHRPGNVLNTDIHALIRDAREHADEEMKDLIYEKRLLAETMISRPVMKDFKAMIRLNGLFERQKKS